MFVDKNTCSECGGKCCKSMPGSCYPDDFNLPGDFAQLEKALSSGKYSIDWWEGDARGDECELSQTYYVRPATKEKEGVLYDASWGGECVFLTENGCCFAEDKRPLNCQKLEPKKDGPCTLHDGVSKQGAAIAWIPYQNKLSDITPA